MIKPTNYLLSQLTGYNGLGMGAFSFSWFNVSWTFGSPMITPRWAVVNITVGVIFATWIITPIIYFANVWNTYDYPVAAVTRSSSHWSALTLVSTSAAFANLAAVVVHMFLHHSNSLWKELRARSLNEKRNDVHCRLNALYPDVPDWWFVIVSVLAFIVIVVIGQVSRIILWYATFLTLIVPIVLVLPFGIVASITGLTIQNPTIYYLLVIIATGLWAENKSTTLAFVTVGYSTYAQTMQLIINMKLGHYMRIAPRILFFVQLVACLVSPALGIGIQYYYFKEQGYITNQNVTTATGNFDSTNVGAAINNEISFFGSADSKNRNLLWSLLIGTLLPIIFWLASRRWNWCHRVHIPLMLTFIAWLPLISTGSLFTWLLIGILQTFLFDELHWKRYVYLITSALNAGFFICWLIIGGPLAQYGVQFPSWWGFGGIHRDGCPLALSNTTGFSVSFEN
jgi:OPT family oligopeptide transporter